MDREREAFCHPLGGPLSWGLLTCNRLQAPQRRNVVMFAPGLGHPGQKPDGSWRQGWQLPRTTAHFPIVAPADAQTIPGVHSFSQAGPADRPQEPGKNLESLALMPGWSMLTASNQQMRRARSVLSCFWVRRAIGASQASNLRQKKLCGSMSMVTRIRVAGFGAAAMTARRKPCRSV